MRRREGRYLLRTNLAAGEPTPLWKFYFQLTEVEQAFRDIKHDLAVRPIYHQLGSRIEAHIFVAFLACCLQVTLKAQLRQLATASGDNLHSGLTAALPKATFEAFGKLNGTL